MLIPLHIWAYALRIWLAAVAALYAAFWLELGGASSAAVTVAVLAQPTRGAALSKAEYRIAATFIGAVMSIAIAGLFPGERIGLLVCFVAWISVCVFAASCLRGYQAYACVLAGYTVAMVTVENIDTPQQVFTTMTNRVAAITVGILCVTFINDVFGSPPVWHDLYRRIREIWHNTSDYARDALTNDRDLAETEATLLSRTAALRDEVDITSHDMADGHNRAAGARSAMLALFEILQQIRLLRLFRRDDALTITIRDQCLASLSGDSGTALRRLDEIRDAELLRPSFSTAKVVQTQIGLGFIHLQGLVEDGLISLSKGLKPARDIRLPRRKELSFALRNTLRIAIALSLVAVFLILAGWPSSAAALTITAVLCGLSTITPNPFQFAIGAMIGFMLASVSAGLIRFYFLTDAQEFVQLAVAMAPVIIFGCLLSAHPKLAGIGAIQNIFFLILLAPSNPQDYNALGFFSECMFDAIALCSVFLASCLVLPLSELDRQRAIVQAVKTSLATAISHANSSLAVLGFTLWSRVSDYTASTAGTGRLRPQLLRTLLVASDLATAMASADTRLCEAASDQAIHPHIARLRRALHSGSSKQLLAGARAILRQVSVSRPALRETLMAAATAFGSAGLLLERERQRIRYFSGKVFDNPGVVR